MFGVDVGEFFSADELLRLEATLKKVGLRAEAITGQTVLA